MNRALIRYLLAVVCVLFIMAACAYGGWTARGWRCASQMAAAQEEIGAKAKKQREATKLIEAKQEDATGQSSQRLDQQQVTQQKEVVYVEKQVVQYRDRWRDRTCQRPADWVQLYNASLFGSAGAVSGTSQAGSAPAGTGL